MSAIPSFVIVSSPPNSVSTPVSNPNGDVIFLSILNCKSCIPPKKSQSNKKGT